MFLTLFKYELTQRLLNQDQRLITYIEDQHSSFFFYLSWNLSRWCCSI